MEGGRVESGRADGETRKKGRGGDEEGWGANTSNWPPWSKKLFQPPSFCLTETFYTGQLTEAGCISANAVFLSTRGWLRFIFSSPSPYIFFLIGENFESPYSATIHQLVCGFDILAPKFTRWTRFWEGGSQSSDFTDSWPRCLRKLDRPELDIFLKKWNSWRFG